jgi:hypothetical protein
MRNKVIGPFFFEETAVTGDTFLGMLHNTFLCHVPLEEVLQLYGAPCHFLAVCVPLWTGSFFMAG